MTLFMRMGLWLGASFMPDVEVSSSPASDNPASVIRLERDPLTIHGTPLSTLYGLLNLMEEASAAAAHFTVPALFMYGAHDELIPKEATLATWRAVRGGSHRLAFYPNGWHLLLRDIDRATPIGDAIAWIHDHAAPLPSGMDLNALARLAGEPA